MTWPAAMRALCAVLLLGACAPRARVVTPPVEAASVFVVRHGEKAPAPPDDPVLSAAGTARAAALDSVLRTEQVTDVVVSHLQRTRLTAAAVIARTRPQVHVVPIGRAGTAAHIAAVADTVRAILAMRPTRAAVLVAGHSNTVAEIVTALSGTAVKPLCDAQYSQLFELRGSSASALRLTRRTYGAPDTVDAVCAPMRR
jgi:phosphohistidine phosphatase SixA